MPGKFLPRMTGSSPLAKAPVLETPSPHNLDSPNYAAVSKRFNAPAGRMLEAESTALYSFRYLYRPRLEEFSIA
jgi:hypothetical protein